MSQHKRTKMLYDSAHERMPFDEFCESIRNELSLLHPDPKARVRRRVKRG